MALLIDNNAEIQILVYLSLITVKIIICGCQYADFDLGTINYNLMKHFKLPPCCYLRTKFTKDSYTDNLIWQRKPFSHLNS